MKKILFASDLDNTLIFSYKHKRAGDRCVEWLEGREQGFCSGWTLERLPELCRWTTFVPVTTRSVAQYQRVAWPEAAVPEYAVTTNGGVLLVGGEVDEEWRRETEALAGPWRGELLRLMTGLGSIDVPKRCRLVDDIYLFAGCDNAADAGNVGAYLAAEAEKGLTVAVSGRKVYVFPPGIDKGAALERLRRRFDAAKVICAGDSVIDIPMLQRADVAIAPDARLLEGTSGVGLLWQDTVGERFADFVVRAALENIL